jgi:phage gp46-like protein
MQDVLIQANEEGIYDLVVDEDKQDFASAEGFESAIPVSFFTDARAPSVQVQEAKDRRGFVGNILFADIERELGGLLWILDQSRITNETLNLAKAFAEGSLSWMVEDGLARNITVTVTKESIIAIKIFTNITTIDNIVLRYVTLWRKTDQSKIETQVA